MPFDPSVIPPKLIEAAKRRKLVPLVGAGISRQAGEAFPNWRELLDYMKERALAEELIKKEESKEIEQLLDRGQFLMVAEALRDRFSSDEYQTILEDKFNPIWAQPVEIHKELFHLHPPLILTTNYDRLLEDAYAAEYGRAVPVLTYRDAPQAQRYLQSSRLLERPIVLKIHGTIDDPADIVLSERDYRELIYRQPGYRLFLSAIFLTHIVLMLGFSFADRELMLLLESLRESLKHQSHPDYIFIPKDSAGSVEMRRLREDFGVHAIPYEPSPGHPEVLEFIIFLVSQIETSHQATSANNV